MREPHQATKDEHIGAASIATPTTGMTREFAHAESG